MPTEFQRDRLTIVLVSPRNPLNIGAAARAMANFGFAHLTVVAPYEPHWNEARSAVGAEDLLQRAKRTECLADAVADCTLVLGTGTTARRTPEQPVLLLPNLAPAVGDELARGGRIALVFGPEKRGLTRDDLARCHALVEIPTHPRQPSMNLGQAVAVCLYELAAHAAHQPDVAAGQALAEQFATSGHLDLLAGVMEETMRAAGYSPSEMQAANRHDLDLLLRRLKPAQGDARRLLGLFRRILYRLQH